MKSDRKYVLPQCHPRGNRRHAFSRPTILRHQRRQLVCSSARVWGRKRRMGGAKRRNPGTRPYCPRGNRIKHLIERPFTAVTPPFNDVIGLFNDVIKSLSDVMRLMRVGVELCFVVCRPTPPFGSVRWSRSET